MTGEPRHAVHGDRAAEQIERILATTRAYLGMDVAFVGELTAERQEYRYVEGQPTAAAVHAGGGSRIEDSYCVRVVAEKLPRVISDTRADERVRDLAITSYANIGSYVGVPITLASGRVYGTLCALGAAPNASLRERDISVVEMLARLIGEEIERAESAGEDVRLGRRRIEAVLAGDGLGIVFQPIVELESLRIVGFEALARFTAEPRRGPDKWFAEARAVGLGRELELRAIADALLRAKDLDGRYLSVNASPETVMSEGFAELLAGCDPAHLVVEITEQYELQDPDAVRAALATARERGVRLAIDDMGAGYSGLRHMLRLGPDIVKIDNDITRDIDTDMAREVLVSATASACLLLDVALIAEGVETAGELAKLRKVGVRNGQGYYLGKPAALPAGKMDASVMRALFSSSVDLS